MAQAPLFSIFLEKGRNFPFPHSSLKYCHSLAGSARTGNRGLVLPHSADHAETLTPPIVLRDKRFTFGQSEMPCYRLWAYLSNKWSCPTGTLAGEASPRAGGSTSTARRLPAAADDLTSRTAHTQFPVALMRPLP